jgi:uncharacterized protein (DUF1330 family)
MTAYLIVETEILDPVQYELYKAAAQEAVAAYGGRYVVRGGEVIVLEGDWNPERMVVLEFADLAAIRAFYGSPDYTEAIALREGAARFRMIAVEGR